MKVFVCLRILNLLLSEYAFTVNLKIFLLSTSVFAFGLEIAQCSRKKHYTGRKLIDLSNLSSLNGGNKTS